MTDGPNDEMKAMRAEYVAIKSAQASDAPERIWAGGFGDSDWQTGAWVSDPTISDGALETLYPVEYIRADVATARIAALEAAIARVLSPAPGVRAVEPWAVGILRAAITP